MLIKQIEKSYREAEAKNYDTLYHYFDIHSTILVPDYNNLTSEFYPYAKETLQLLTKYCDLTSPRLVLGLYTCSHPQEIERYLKFFEENDIHFKYVNENPEVGNTRLGNFDKKLYFNVYYEDKAGFDPSEWEGMYNFFKNKFADIKN